MNTLTANELARLRRVTADDVARQWARTSVLVGCIEGTIVPHGSAQASFRVDHGILEMPVPGTDADGNVPARLSWARYEAHCTLSEHETSLIRDALVSDKAPRQRLLNACGEKIISAAAKLANSVEADAHVGTGVDSVGRATLVGLYGGALGTSSYGGINPTAAPCWTSGQISNGGTPRTCSPDTVERADEWIFMASPAHAAWDMVLTSAGVIRKYSALFTEDWSHMTLHPLQRARIMEELQPVYGRFCYKGRPAWRSQWNPTGTLALLNTRHLKIQCEAPPGMELLGDEAPVKATSLPLHFAMETPGKLTLSISLAMALTKRNAFAVVSDISEG
jgi:hypothetical protein